MDSLSSSASTVPSFDDYFAHNMWNPLLEMLFLEQVNEQYNINIASLHGWYSADHASDTPLQDDEPMMDPVKGLQTLRRGDPR